MTTPTRNHPWRRAAEADSKLREARLEANRLWHKRRYAHDKHDDIYRMARNESCLSRYHRRKLSAKAATT